MQDPRLRAWFHLLVRLTVPFADVFQAMRAMYNLPHFIQSYRAYRRATTEDVPFIDLYPCLGEATTANAVTPYMYESVWATRHILARQPTRHVDIGSQVFFILMLAPHIRTLFLDVRSIAQSFGAAEFSQASVTALPFANDSLPSVSCLSVAEHIGLARYDTQIDPLGTRHAARELSRVLIPGGSLYFSLPLGQPRVLFNAHRVHSFEQIRQMFPSLVLQEFALVDARGQFIPHADPELSRTDDCPSGMFCFTKPG